MIHASNILLDIRRKKKKKKKKYVNEKSKWYTRLLYTDGEIKSFEALIGSNCELWRCLFSLCDKYYLMIIEPMLESLREKKQNKDEPFETAPKNSGISYFIHWVYLQNEHQKERLSKTGMSFIYNH